MTHTAQETKNILQLENLHLGSMSLSFKPKLKSLSLSNNALSSLHSSLLIPTSSFLEILDLSGNPWSCDCKTSYFLISFLQNINISRELEGIQCWNPSDYRGQDILLFHQNCVGIHNSSGKVGVLGH